MIGETVLVEPLAGAVIAATGVLPRLTVTVAAVEAPNALLQITLIELAPSESATELVVALVLLAPFTVQVLPAGIDAAPLTVYATLIVVAVVFDRWPAR